MFVNNISKLCFYIMYLRKTNFRVSRKFMVNIIEDNCNYKLKNNYQLLPRSFIMHMCILLVFFFILTSLKFYLSILFFCAILYCLYLVYDVQENYLLYQKCVCCFNIMTTLSESYWTHYNKHNNLNILFYNCMFLNKIDNQSEKSSLETTTKIMIELYRYLLLKYDNDEKRAKLILLKVVDDVEEPNLNYKSDPLNGDIFLCLIKEMFYTTYSQLFCFLNNETMFLKLYNYHLHHEKQLMLQNLAPFNPIILYTDFQLTKLL